MMLQNKNKITVTLLVARIHMYQRSCRITYIYIYVCGSTIQLQKSISHYKIFNDKLTNNSIPPLASGKSINVYFSEAYIVSHKAFHNSLITVLNKIQGKGSTTTKYEN